MKTLICILSKGLRRMTVKATAAGPDVEVVVEYSGALDEWGTYYHTSTLRFLEFFLRERARNLMAKVEVSYYGEYEETRGETNEGRPRLTFLIRRRAEL